MLHPFSADRCAALAGAIAQRAGCADRVAHHAHCSVMVVR
jgi:nucleotide-binding universal stress UspA family protein